MYNKILRYRCGVIACQDRFNGVPIEETLAKFNASGFEEFNSNNKVSEAIKSFVNVVETSFRALDHTPEATKQVKECFYAVYDLLN